VGLTPRPDHRVVEYNPSSQEGWVASRLDFLVNWGRANSLWPMPFGTACCAIEFMATAASRFDLARFGMERMSFSPRQADVLICAGRVPFKLAPVIRRIWQQMPQPKWAIAMGACASTGNIFDNYAVVQGIDTIIPVDVYVPGCPPRPEGLMYGIMMLQEKVMRERMSDVVIRNEMEPDPKSQLYIPAHINRKDCNPRPHSPDIPANRLIGCVSADNQWLFATAWEPTQELFQGVITCLHNDFRLGGLAPGETKRAYGKIYVQENNVDTLLARYERDFARARR